MLQAEKTLEATGALLEYIKKSSNQENDSGKTALFEADAEPIYIQISTKKFVSDKKILKPKRAAIPHSFVKDASVCIFTKDPQRTYKNALLEDDSAPTKDMISRIIGVSKLKGKFKQYEARRQLLSMYDIFLAEDSVVTTLPKLLGKVFYDGPVTKMPLPIRMKSTGSDGKISATKVQGEIEKIVKSTVFTLSPGTSVSIKVGDSSFTAQQLQENIDAVVDYFTKNIPKGTWENIRAVNVKSTSSPALPIYITEKVYSEQDVKSEEESDVTKKSSKSSEKRKREAPTLTRLERALSEVVDEEELQRYIKKPVKQETVANK